MGSYIGCDCTMEGASPETELRRLVDDYRAQCLWFLREGYYPDTPQERERALTLIARRGDLRAFRRVAEVRAWRLRDRATLVRSACTVRTLRERPGYVEAVVSRQGQDLVVEWARDSAFRFFPLVKDDDLGLEVSTLAFEGPPPSAGDLSRRWRQALESAGPIIDTLPATHVGQAVITADAQLFVGGASELAHALGTDAVTFHEGRIGGAWPTVKR